MAGLHKRRRLDPTAFSEEHHDSLTEDNFFPEAFSDANEIDHQAFQHDEPLPSDTMAAILLLRQQFPSATETVALILRSQLYTVVKDRNLVDRDLEKHRDSAQLRVIKLPSSVDDYGYVLQEDYLGSIDLARDAEKEKANNESELAIFDRFKEWVVPQWKEASISHSQLMTLLAEAPGNSSRQRGANRLAVTDRQVALLLGSGLLTRQVGTQSSYLFAVAGAGRMVTSITKGRKEIIGTLSRKRHKEAFLKDLKKMKLRGSCLGMQWHLRDLLGRGSITQIPSPSGPLLRLTNKER